MAKYTIIGSDGREYGPVSTEDLQKWIAEGRANAQTQVRAEGATDFQPLAAVPELNGPYKAPPPPLPIRPLAATTPAAKTSIMAILSLVFGVLACTSPFGLILGIIAMVQISKSRGTLGGKGLALAGIIVSGLFLVMIPFFAALLLPALAAAQHKAQQINCMNNEKQLALAVRIYSGDNTDHFPPAATWCDAINTAVGSARIFKCPAASESSRCDYAFNAKLDGLEVSKVDPQTVMIFESDSGWDAHGGPELLAHRHARNNVLVAFADGHVEAVTEARASSLRWNP